MAEQPQLFHRIGETASAAARRAVTALGLLDRIRFRNLYYPEVEHDFLAHGGRQSPALWDGTRWREGEAEVLRALDAMAGPGGPPPGQR